MKNTDIKEMYIKGKHVLTYGIINNKIHLEIKHPELNLATALRLINRTEKTTIKEYVKIK